MKLFSVVRSSFVVCCVSVVLFCPNIPSVVLVEGPQQESHPPDFLELSVLGYFNSYPTAGPVVFTGIDFADFRQVYLRAWGDRCHDFEEKLIFFFLHVVAFGLVVLFCLK